MQTNQLKLSRFRQTFFAIIILFVAFILRIFSDRILSTHLDVPDFGNYVAIAHGILLLASVILIGSDLALLNFMSEYFSLRNWPKAKGYILFFIHFFTRIILAILVITAIVASLEYFDKELFFEQFTSHHIIMKYLWLSPLILLSYFFGKLLYAIQFKLLSQILSDLLFRIVQISILSVLLFKHITLTTSNAVFVYAISYFVALLFILITLKFVIPSALFSASADTTDKSLWVKTASEIFMANFFFTNLATMMIITDKIFDHYSYNTGYLSIIILVSTFLWLSSNAIQLIYTHEMLPYIKEKKTIQLQKLVNECFLYLLYSSIVLLSVFCFFHHSILGFFGPQYTHLFYPALIYFFFYTLTLLTTPLIYIMIYGGHQHLLAITSIWLVLGMLSLGGILINTFSFWGALTLMNIVQIIFAIVPILYIRKEMHIVPFKFYG